MEEIKDQIPKVIHYCWFGGNPLSDLAQKCIASWKKFLPDYEIKEWNELNFDINSCDYVREAYENKMWAFVSDYSRFKILYEFGGLYFDTDVELIKPIDDIISHGSFMGCEAPPIIKKNTIKILINSGNGLAAIPGLIPYKDILNSYETSHFITRDGLQDITTVVTRVTNIMINYGYNTQATGIQVIKNINIYPFDFFCPLNYYTGKLVITKNTRSIHHYSESWHNPIEKKIEDLQRQFTKSENKGTSIKKIVIIYPLIVINSIQKYGLFKTFRKIISKL